MNNILTDDKYMELAIEEAKKAYDLMEIPIGAVIVRDGYVVGKGFNRKETDKDATLHAEMIAIRQACAALGGWRLPGCTMYVTLEPCAMCTGALVNARVERLVIGAPDLRTGACGSVMNIADTDYLNHRIDVTFGVRESECSILLKEFFKELRLRYKKG